jgi:hypothetical protein
MRCHSTRRPHFLKGGFMNITRVFFSALTALTLSAGTALAQVNIDHAAALAGNVTPGDAAGYPVTIGQSGHYKLTGNLSVPAGTTGIQVTADNVTLDLNGYTIGSSGSCQLNSRTYVFSCSHTGLAGQGVHVTGQNATVRKGTVKGFAVGLSFSLGNQTVEDLTVSSNWDKGISVINEAGQTRISESLVELNGLGIMVKKGLIERSRVVRNGTHGILSALTGGMRQVLVSDCVTNENLSYGLAWVAARGTMTWGHLEVVSLGGNFNGNGSF